MQSALFKRPSSAAAASTGGPEQHPVLIELRRKWTIVLRECQKSDPERTGIVPRSDFLAALDFAAMGKNMTPELRNKIADTYMVADGKVDYLTCFRNYLNELIGIMPSMTSEFKRKEGHQAREFRGNHPWEFDYDKTSRQLQSSDKKSAAPYWSKASQLKQNIPGIVSKSRPATAVLKASKSTADLSDSDRASILSKYDPRVVGICRYSSLSVIFCIILF
jgi:hypothetical protein